MPVQMPARRPQAPPHPTTTIHPVNRERQHAMKTPEEIATEAMQAFTIAYDEDVEERSSTFIHEQIAAAIEADRKQRNPGSASDRIERATAALNHLDRSVGLHVGLEDELADALRPFLSAPEVNVPTDLISVYVRGGGDRPGTLAWPGAYRERFEAALTAVFQAGINAAFESWEPGDYTEPESVIAALRRALLDRGDAVAAEWVVANADELWGTAIGPLLDDIQKNYGGAQAWSPSGDPLPPVDAAARFEPEVESAIRSEARSAIAARGHGEYDEYDPRL